MITKFGNKNIKVAVSDKGAELMSVIFDGREYLWQGDVDVWEDRAPVLFPICGRLHNAKYLHEGREYDMGIHGFLWKCTLEKVEENASGVKYVLTDNEYTGSIYPFAFRAEVGYKVDGNSLTCSFKVRNTGVKDMYFSHGYHPGFNLPLCDEDCFEDCYIEFSETCEPKLVEMSNTTYLVTENYPSFPLEDKKILHLTHTLFNERSVFLKDMARELTIKGKNTDRSITVTFAECEILGLWQAANKQAKYLCIEPWNGLPDRDGVTGEIKDKLLQRTLKPGEVFENEIKITLN